MKKFFLIIFFFTIKFNLANSSINIVYLDIQFIIDNSEMGILYRNKINKQNELIKSDLLIKEKQIKIKEKEINDQKNIIKKEEIEKMMKNLNILLKEYQNKRIEVNNNLRNEKKKYSQEILKVLNPILTDYVEKNNITLVLDKKNILVGIKTLDITKIILEIFNNKTKNIILNNEN